MHKILFVDDDPTELAALQTLLRAYRRNWQMTFCQSGPEAIQQMAENKFDVVVTELKMTGMSGAELLRYVRELYPDTVRLLLCSQAEYSELFNSVGPAQQYLTKPCDPELLYDVVNRTCLLNERLAQTGLRAVVSKVDALPSLPAVYLRLVDELRREDASVDRIGDLISKDLGMTAKVLQLVNSSFFGLPVHVKDAAHAAALLGLNTLRPLVLTAGVFRQLEKSRIPAALLEKVMKHSMAVGCLAKRLAEIEGMNRDDSDNALLAGILHDIGKLVLAENIGRDYSIVTTAAEITNLPLEQAEHDQFDTSHAEVGGYLAAIWGLPQDILEAIAYHHDPSGHPGKKFSGVTAVHAANALVNEAELLESESELQRPTRDRLDHSYLARLNCTQSVDLWREIALQKRAAC
ncbi:response regulator [Adhaeretor mobilis]|nr:response regulator [Adhaeretor mobilis]